MRVFKLFFLGVFCVLFSCDEERRQIIPVVPSGNRIVLLEEFTGKGCTNCPKGSREIDNLLSIYGENLAVISIHAGFFADPTFFNYGQFDLRTSEGEELYEYLGPNLGYPAGVIDRTIFNNELQHSANAWASFIAEEIAIEPSVEFSLTTGFDQTSRLLQVSLDGISKANLSGEIRLSVAIAENGIIDAQDDFEAGGVVDDYEHKHVLRTMLTKFDGDKYSDGLQTGGTIERDFSTTLNELWVVENCEIVAFISLVDSQNNSFEVLQAGKKEIID